MTAGEPAPAPRTGSGEARDSAPAATRPAEWDVATLCGETGEAVLVHNGEHYRLRVTARGRLILTK